MKSGFVSQVGRPNAGKSTLLNRIVGHKLAIVSDKPQTTRTRIVGVKNYVGGPDKAPPANEGQAVFVDTPGIHKPTHRMNVRMVDVAPHPGCGCGAVDAPAARDNDRVTTPRRSRAAGTS